MSSNCSFNRMAHPSFPSDQNQYLSEHVHLLLSSYQHWCQQSLIQSQSSIEDAKHLFHAPFAVLSHSNDDDPVFTYANQIALQTFGYDWQELMVTPSRYSAEPVNREERSKMLEVVNQQGYTDQYSGIRIAKNGTRFRIQQATVWNLIDEHGKYQGQAAMFSDWDWIK